MKAPVGLTPVQSKRSSVPPTDKDNQAQQPQCSEGERRRLWNRCEELARSGECPGAAAERADHEYVVGEVVLQLRDKGIGQVCALECSPSVRGIVGPVEKESTG